MNYFKILYCYDCTWIIETAFVYTVFQECTCKMTINKTATKMRIYINIPIHTDARIKSLEMLDFSLANLISPRFHADLDWIKILKK